MKNEVKSKRAYQSQRRDQQAASTRLAVLEAARASFIALGWNKTTIAAISDGAGVSKETIYAVFGSKQVVLEQVIGAAIQGAQTDVPILQQAIPQALAQQTDQIAQVDLFASDIAQVLSRVAPLIGVVRSAAETVPAMGALYARLHTQRRKNFEFVANALLRNGSLKGGVSAEAAAKTIARLTSPELFLLMATVENLSVDDYAAWLREVLTACLLPGSGV